MRCARAFTTLVLPVTFGSVAESPAVLAARLASRERVRSNGREVDPLWEETTPRLLAPQLPELNPAVRALLGDPEVPGDEGWRCRWLALSEPAKQALFRHLTLVYPDEARARVGVLGVEVVLFPLGSGALVLRLDWTCGGRRVLDAQALRQGLAVARQLDGRGGWTLGRSGPEEEAPRPLSEAYASFLGDDLVASLSLGQAVSLREVARWLLRQPPTPDGEPAADDGGSRFAWHHTAAVLEERPSPEDERALLFHLRRGVGADQLPPEDPGTSDRVWNARANRRLGVCREGSVSLSWPDAGASPGFERDGWPRRFQGIYLALALQVLSERVTLAGLGARASSLVVHVHASRLAHAEAEVGHAIATLRTGRRQLLSLAHDMVHYTLAISTDDCGGPSDYLAWFQACRDVHGIPGQRAELRAEVAEVLGLVEVEYR